jgi:formylmethanofuran dehydrogenase subunit E
MHQSIDDPDDNDYLYGSGNTFYFDIDQYAYDDYPVIVEKKVNKTCVCDKCGELYPHSEPNREDGSFRCWGCCNY